MKISKEEAEKFSDLMNLVSSNSYCDEIAWSSLGDLLSNIQNEVKFEVSPFKYVDDYKEYLEHE